MRFVALALLTVLAAPLPTRAAEPEPYIFDVLALQPYKGNFARLVKPKTVPDWVKAISVQGAGTAGPMKTVDVGGTPYRLDRVCRVDACADNRIDVLWAPRGARVWGALVEDGQPPVMLGEPKGPQAKALETAAAAAPAQATAAPATPATPAAPTAPAAPAAPAVTVAPVAPAVPAAPPAAPAVPAAPATPEPVQATPAAPK